MTRQKGDVDDPAALAPRIVVKFVDHIPLLDADDVASSIRRHGLGSWDALLRSFPGITIRPAFPAVWNTLDEHVKVAMLRSPEYVPPNFKAYFIVVVPLETDVQSIIAELRKWRAVETAYLSSWVVPTAVNTLPNPGEVFQTYHQPAPAGIDAQYAWTVPGGDGANQAFADIEASGCMLDHEDLTSQNIVLLPNGVNGVDPYHGTEVLGVIFGTDNGVGGVGIVPNASQCGFFPVAANTPSVTQAILQSLGFLRAGNVLLLEVGLGNGVPMEGDQDALQAIQLAVAQGIVVIEGAGNNAVNLDTWVDINGKNRMNRASLDFVDSGAVMVGACSAGVPHQEIVTSSAGNRIDCYAQGQSVYTCWPYDPNLNPPAYADGGTSNGVTRPYFGQTSAASAIVAGAAISAQGMSQIATGSQLSPRTLRFIFSNPIYGTPVFPLSGNPLSAPIGVMPDLRQVADFLSADSQVFIRHYIGDTGVPDPTFAGAFSASPDIVLASTVPQSFDPQSLYGEQSGTADTLSQDSIIAGQDNYIFLRARNRGATAAANVQGLLFYAPPATLVQPNLWTQIGDVLGDLGSSIVSFPEIPPGDALTASNQPFVWQAAKVPAPGHYCYVAVIGSASQPLPDLASLNFLNDIDYFVNFIKTNTTVAWRNFNIVEMLHLPRGFSHFKFLVPGLVDRTAQMTLEVFAALGKNCRLLIEGPPHLLTCCSGPLAALQCALSRMDASLPPPAKGTIQLPVPLHQRFCLEGLSIPRRSRAEMTLHFDVPPEARKSPYTVFVRQLYKNTEVGRVTWRLVPENRTLSRRRTVENG